MNVPHSESEKKAMELVEKFCKSLYGTWSIIREEEKPLLKELLLHCYTQGVANFAHSVKMPLQAKGAYMAKLEFNVIWPVTNEETLPSEEK